jgi:glycosyltransferase involved in cell wall biosynthesis
MRRHLLHVFPSFAVGGSQTRFAQLVRLHGARYRHTVIALDGDLAMAGRLPADAPVTLVRERFRTKSPLKGISTAYRMLRRVRPDLLVTYNWGSLDWCIARRFMPALAHVHMEDGFGPEEKAHQLGRRRLLRRLTLGDPGTIVVVPSHTLKKIALQSWRLPPRGVRYIANGIEFGRFAAQAGPAGNRGPVVVGTVASLRPEKNLTRLIGLFCEAARQLPAGSISLQIVGGGPELPALRAAAAESGFADRITLAGPTTRPEEFLKGMDIFALTSDTEQMPLSVIEAMAAGLPILSFNVGDVPAMVAPENVEAACLPRHDDASYVRQLLALAGDAERRRRIGQANAAKAAASFDEAAMAAHYAELFG